MQQQNLVDIWSPNQRKGIPSVLVVTSNEKCGGVSQEPPVRGCRINTEHATTANQSATSNRRWKYEDTAAAATNDGDETAIAACSNIGSGAAPKGATTLAKSVHSHSRIISALVAPPHHSSINWNMANPKPYLDSPFSKPCAVASTDLRYGSEHVLRTESDLNRKENTERLSLQVIAHTQSGLYPPSSLKLPTHPPVVRRVKFSDSRTLVE